MAAEAKDGEPFSDDDMAGAVEGEKEDEDEEGEKESLDKPPSVFVLVVKHWVKPPEEGEEG
eukprot:CAMPEP_0119504988 /NCGR_PEP_ID=MMETSP1344-20130328/25670_1 /TAXON_ID=236787 /ORGANISM="Florenciella parvula, Strain CCMP2471" /LENGTH=60 /DNA_ID=CAMNT_0007541409 /DNA_START=154 /DNA_END=333 /DNA_ORIENTATION=+